MILVEQSVPVEHWLFIQSTVQPDSLLRKRKNGFLCVFDDTQTRRQLSDLSERELMCGSNRPIGPLREAASGDTVSSSLSPC